MKGNQQQRRASFNTSTSRSRERSESRKDLNNPTSPTVANSASNTTTANSNTNSSSNNTADIPPACAECRRVKRRCSRKWPCQSCVRRGCASICPDGTLTPGGGGNRYILHGSEQLHRRIKEMSTRIGQLEDALAALWPEGHPLLRRELLNVKLPPDTQNLETLPDEDEASGGEEEDQLVDEEVRLAKDLDVLALGERDDDRGRSTRGERLGISTIEFILNSDEYNNRTSTNQPSQTNHQPQQQGGPPTDGTRLPLAPTIIKISAAFPSTIDDDCPIDLSTLLIYLPPLPLAIRLTKSYFNNAGWTYGAIGPQENFLTDFLPLFYNMGLGGKTNPTPHELALLYMVFAVGALVDLDTSSSVSDQCERYHTLAKAAVCLKSPLVGGGGIALVEVLSFMITYAYMWDLNEVKMDRVAVVMALASKWGMTTGLHRDAARLKLDPKELQRRRFVFWELFTTNAWQSLSSGRPSFLQLEHADCLPPIDPGEQITPLGKKTIRHPHDFDKFRFARECLWPIIDSNFNLTKPVNYAAVLALDRKVREFVHADVGPAMSSLNNPTLAMEMQTHASAHVKEHVMLQLHRAFFSHAMMHNPDSPLDSPYASSVLATFKCAVTILEGVKVIYQKLPAAVIPYGLSFGDVLGSAVVMGTICSKGVRGSLAPVAYNHLRVAVHLVESRFADKPRAKSGLPVLYKLQDEAHRAIAALGPGPTSSMQFAVVGSGGSRSSPPASNSHESTSTGPTAMTTTEPSPPPPPPPPYSFDIRPAWQDGIGGGGMATIAGHLTSSSSSAQQPQHVNFSMNLINNNSSSSNQPTNHNHNNSNNNNNMNMDFSMDNMMDFHRIVNAPLPNHIDTSSFTLDPLFLNSTNNNNGGNYSAGGGGGGGGYDWNFERIFQEQHQSPIDQQQQQQQHAWNNLPPSFGGGWDINSMNTSTSG